VSLDGFADGGNGEAAGGGIFSLGGYVSLDNTTVASNVADTGGGVMVWGPDSTFSVFNSVIGDSAGSDDCVTDNPFPIIANSIIETTSSCGDQQGDAGLGPLALNSPGFTPTHSLLPGSPAIDAGDNDRCVLAHVNNEDQRGAARPFDGNSDGAYVCDIGAYEACAAYSDCDGDGYGDGVEQVIGTSAFDACGKNGWPSNLVDPGSPFPANTVDIFDVTSYLAPKRRLDTNLGDFADNNRWDLIPGPTGLATDVNIFDVTALFNGPDGSGAYPPMFGGQRAWERVCPLPP
jgi:hypothetical protein